VELLLPPPHRPPPRRRRRRRQRLAFGSSIVGKCFDQKFPAMM
jgi:hypothetical protein